MVSLEYFVAAEAISVDAQTNKISFFQVLEEIRGPAPDGPADLPTMSIVSAWNIEDADLGKDFQAGIAIVKPDGSEVASNTANFTATGSSGVAPRRASAAAS